MSRRGVKRRCEWCGRMTARFRWLVGEDDADGNRTYECLEEKRCTAPIKGSANPSSPSREISQERPLLNAGIAKVLASVRKHNWNFTEAAKEYGVGQNSVSRFVQTHAGVEYRFARYTGLIRGGNRYTKPAALKEAA